MSSRGALVLVLAAALAAAAPRPARADEPPAPASDPDAQAKARARVLLDAGNQLQDAGDHLGALELFRQAHAAYASPRLRVAIATSLWNLGRFREASEELEAALATGSLDPQLAAEVEAQLGELARAYAVVTITLDATDAAAARVHVDGRRVAVEGGAAVARVDPGAHAIVVEAPGAPPWTETLELAAGERRTLGVDLEPAPAAPPRVVERVVTRAPALRGTGARAGASLGVLVDAGGPGAAAAIGGGWGVTPWLDLGGGVIAGGQVGAWAGATAFARPAAATRPTATVALVAFAAGQLEPGARLALGVEWRATDRVELTAQLGVELYPWVPDDHVTTLVVPALGVVARP